MSKHSILSMFTDQNGQPKPWFKPLCITFYMTMAISQLFMMLHYVLILSNGGDNQTFRLGFALALPAAIVAFSIYMVHYFGGLRQHETQIVRNEALGEVVH